MRAPTALTILLMSLTAPTADATTGDPNLLANPGFAVAGGACPDGWSVWSPRDGLAPLAEVQRLSDGNALSLTSKGFEDYGKWIARVSGIEPGRFYRFEVRHQAKNIESEDVSVCVLLTWLGGSNGSRELQRDYVDQSSPLSPREKRAELATARERVGVRGADLGWRRNFRTLQAPSGAKVLEIELMLRWTNGGSVLFKDPSLIEVPAPASRRVRIATTHIRPVSHPTVESNMKLMSDMLDKIGPQKPDIVLFSENLSDRSVGLSLRQTSRPIPGPLTDRLGEKARQYHTYVSTTLHESDGDRIYNTAVLIDREGRITGKYRKVHLAMSEAEAGITPGSDYPVFETDFGRIGILTCWDNWFSEPARILRLKGAEMILWPLAGDGVPTHYDAISRARAMENGVYIISSSTVADNPSSIINPAGQVLAEANGAFASAIQDIDLNQEWRVRYLSVASGDGEARSLYIRERRPDTYDSILGDSSLPKPR